MRKSFTTLKPGTHVTWPYRGAIGHGTVKGVVKKGTTAGSTEYSIHETDHHPGEKATLHHYGRVLTKAK